MGEHDKEDIKQVRCNSRIDLVFYQCLIIIFLRSWDRVCVVLKGTEIIFYKDQKSYRSAPSSTFKGEPAVEILGATAAVASDYTKKKNVFRLK